MSPLSNIWARNQGGSTAGIPAADLQLRTHTSRESDTTTSPTPTLDARMSSTPTLSPPPLHHAPRQLNDEAFGEFFGGRARTRAPQLSRAPPPYSPDWDGEKLPGYSTSPEFEMETVARHLFKYGFFFPVFWAIGVYFLFVPLRVSADWQSDRTEEDKEKMLSEMRTTEVKWARRCLWALLSFFLCITLVVVAVVVSRR